MKTYKKIESEEKNVSDEILNDLTTEQNEPQEPAQTTMFKEVKQEPNEPNEPHEASEPKKRKYNKTGKYKKGAESGANEPTATKKGNDNNVTIVTDGNTKSDDFFKDYQQTQQGNEQGKTEDEKRTYSNYVSGYLFLICLDVVLPEMLIYIFGMYDKKFKEINAKDLQLTEDEKKIIEPLADEVVKELFGTMSPVSQFIFTMSFMYGGKLMVARTTL
jgi:hypothetical protein